MKKETDTLAYMKKELVILKLRGKWKVYTKAWYYAEAETTVNSSARNVSQRLAAEGKETTELKQIAKELNIKVYP